MNYHCPWCQGFAHNQPCPRCEATRAARKQVRMRDIVETDSAPGRVLVATLPATDAHSKATYSTVVMRCNETGNPTDWEELSRLSYANVTDAIEGHNTLVQTLKKS